MGIETDLAFVRVVDIGLISVWGIEIDLISVCGSELTCYCVGRILLVFVSENRNGLDFRVEIEIDLISVLGSKLACSLCVGIN